jgi:hypothetical protein
MTMLHSARALLRPVLFSYLGIALLAAPAFAQSTTSTPAATPAPAAVPAPAATPAPKKQLPADERAFKAARATTDPEQRLTALHQFVQQFPKSTRVSRAQSEILDILLKNFPDRAAEINAQAKIEIKQSGKGSDRLREASDVANRFADAGTNGVDLPQAEKWSKEYVDKLTEPAYDAQMAKVYKKYKVPLPKPEDLHKSYSNERAGALASLGNVYLREGKLPQAKAVVAESYALDPTLDETNSLRGQIALLDHNDVEALSDFERAQLLGELKSPWRGKMLELYRAQHGGSDAGLVAEMDAKYATLYPAPFTPATPAAITGGHAVLLELFTGSACPPCVGGDLAVEAFLKAYPRSELVVLAFDQHIPDPDPLANADSVARATLYNINGTPMYAIDGKLQSSYGSSRDGAENLYKTLDKRVAIDAAKPSGVDLKLTASRKADGNVQAQALVTVGDAAALVEEPDPAPKPDDKAAADSAAKKTDKKADKKKSTTPAPAATTAAAAPAAPAAPELVLNFALVEDDIRYSGENGLRFHRMVVRSLAKDADTGFPLEMGKTATLDTTFNPAEISKKLSAYLADYEKNNDRFGQIEFLSKDTTIDPNHLAIVAWVQDSGTHRVLQAAYVPLNPTAMEAKK